MISKLIEVSVAWTDHICKERRNFRNNKSVSTKETIDSSRESVVYVFDDERKIKSHHITSHHITSHHITNQSNTFERTIEYSQFTPMEFFVAIRCEMIRTIF
jgi:hypothetical protein